VVTHLMACALYCNSDGSLNSGGQFLADLILWGGGIILGIAALAAVIRNITRAVTPPAQRPHRQPMDTSPFLAELLGGTPQGCWHGKVNAVTPGGTRATGKCCPRGHRSPDLAAACADRANTRIARYGR
jgi:hypothetical protein